MTAAAALSAGGLLAAWLAVPAGSAASAAAPARAAAAKAPSPSAAISACVVTARAETATGLPAGEAGPAGIPASRPVEVLASYDADRPRPIASLAKLMLELLVVEAVEAGRLSLDTPIVVSPAAARTPGATAGLIAGRPVPAGRLLWLAALDSANDAAVALAEGLCGSEAACTERMNRRAAALGLTATRFENVTGLPLGTGRSATVASACDVARLAAEVLRHPLVPSARRRAGGRLLRVLKTGASREAGYGLVASDDGTAGPVVVAVLGAPSNEARLDAAARWLDRGLTLAGPAPRAAGARARGRDR